MVPFALVLIVTLFVTGAPLFVAVGLGSALICVFAWGLPVETIGALAFQKMNSWILLAVPLFMLAGNLTFTGGCGKRFLNLVRSWLGHFPGGLLIATVAFGTLFATVTGSPIAAIAVIGPVMGPEMLKRGYSQSVSGAILVAAARLGNIIPPSTTFIILSAMMETSAATLFMAGAVPGLVLALMLVVAGTIVAMRHGLPREEPASWRTRLSILAKALPAMFIAVVILGGIYGGMMTPTEAAAIACVYTIFLGWVVYREFTLKSFYDCFVRSAKSAGMIYALIASIGLFGYTISRIGMPQLIATTMAQYEVSPLLFVLIFNLVFVILGFVIPPVTTMLIMIPIIMPTLLALDINLIWMAVLMVLNVDLGGMTPPMAFGIYIAAGITGIPAPEIIKGIVPHCIVFFVGIILLVFVPNIALWLPRLMGLYGA